MMATCDKGRAVLQAHQPSTSCNGDSKVGTWPDNIGAGARVFCVIKLGCATELLGEAKCPANTVMRSRWVFMPTTLSSRAAQRSRTTSSRTRKMF